MTGNPIYKLLPNGKLTVLVPYFSLEKVNNGLVEKKLLENVELRLIRVQYPYLDSAIFAQYIALNAGKYNFARIQKMTFTKTKMVNGNTSTEQPEGTVLPSQVTGMKLELAGRLTTQRSIPRKTVENISTGSFSRLSLNLSRYSSKNKIGAYTIKV